VTFSLTVFNVDDEDDNRLGVVKDGEVRRVTGQNNTFYSTPVDSVYCPGYFTLFTLFCAVYPLYYVHSIMEFKKIEKNRRKQ
jgi:hypothetical protein